MNIQRFLIICVVWTVLCIGLVEPLWIAPLFDSEGWIQLAFNNQLNGDSLALPLQGLDSISDDHFRMLAMLYMGVPCLIGLALQAIVDHKDHNLMKRLN